MNEYTVLYLNGINFHFEAKDWKDAILEARTNAENKLFNTKMKYIIDGEGECIKNIDEQTLTYNQKITECVSLKKDLI